MFDKHHYNGTVFSVFIVIEVYMSFPISKETKSKMMSEGVFPITTVNLEVIQDLITWIIERDQHVRDLCIYINSSGGSSRAIIYFASFLKNLPEELKITGVATGECGSAALALLQCCHERFAVPHTAFFIHHINSNTDYQVYDPDVDQKIKAAYETSKLIEDELVGIQCKKSGISKKDWKSLADNGSLSQIAIMSEKALELGLIDKIIDRFAIF